MWNSFWFESNQSWGKCNGPHDWKIIKGNYLKYWRTYGGLDLNKVYVHGGVDIELMKSGERGWNFGTRSEYNGSYSLADFARDYNMEL